MGPRLFVQVSTAAPEYKGSKCASSQTSGISMGYLLDMARVLTRQLTVKNGMRHCVLWCRPVGM